jgi:hypothetical protein
MNDARTGLSFRKTAILLLVAACVGITAPATRASNRYK